MKLSNKVGWRKLESNLKIFNGSFCDILWKFLQIFAKKVEEKVITIQIKIKNYLESHKTVKSF